VARRGRLAGRVVEGKRSTAGGRRDREGAEDRSSVKAQVDIKKRGVDTERKPAFKPSENKRGLSYRGIGTDGKRITSTTGARPGTGTKQRKSGKSARGHTGGKTGNSRKGGAVPSVRC